jgi:hypothetical protein
MSYVHNNVDFPDLPDNFDCKRKNMYYTVKEFCLLFAGWTFRVSAVC